MNLPVLSNQIDTVDRSLSSAASKAVNSLLTARNWLIGYHLHEYELHGEDRAKYGESYVKELAKQLDSKGLSARNLWLFRQFYLSYPQIGQALTSLPEVMQSPIGLPEPTSQSKPSPIVHTASALSSKHSFPETSETVHTACALFTPSDSYQELLAKLPELHVPGDKLLTRPSFSHLKLLIPLNEPLKRTFYEIEAIKGTWAVRELKRQVGSLYFERSGLSTSPETLSELTQATATSAPPLHLPKDLYTFEFLGLPPHLAVEEQEFEAALLDHLQTFLIELGHGFCLEARQKRLLIGDDYYFVDLVFYHRILKCHVLVELKVGSFSHENAGQLNTYLNYYRAEVTREDDNPPVGLLLVAEKNSSLVQYATAGMDENIFVRQYQLHLPDKATLTRFLDDELNRL